MGDDAPVIRDLIESDWPGVASLLGQEATYGERLARHMAATYRPWFGRVVSGAAGGGACGPDAAVVAGVRRRLSDGSPAAVTVAWVGVAPGRRRAGIGRRLVEQVAVEAARLGARRLDATVGVADDRARAFLHACGFAVERRTESVRVEGSAAPRLAAARPPAGVVVRPLRHDEIPALSGLLIHLAIERATDPHDDLDGLTPSVVAAAAMRVEHVAVAAWEADDPDAPLGVAWGTRLPEGVRVHFVGVHEDARRRGTGRALLGALLAASRGRALLATVHDPDGVHSFLERCGATVTTQTADLARPIEAPPGAILETSHP